MCAGFTFSSICLLWFTDVGVVEPLSSHLCHFRKKQKCFLTNLRVQDLRAWESVGFSSFCVVYRTSTSLFLARVMCSAAWSGLEQRYLAQQLRAVDYFPVCVMSLCKLSRDAPCRSVSPNGRFGLFLLEKFGSNFQVLQTGWEPC